MFIGVAALTIKNGANFIEKYFYLDRFEFGVDSTFSIEHLEFKKLAIESKNA